MLGYGKTRLTRLFLPTPSARRATSTFWRTPSKRTLFLPTPSARRATDVVTSKFYIVTLFLPTPSARRATEFFLADQCAEKFLPTPSARRAPRFAIRGVDKLQFLPTPSARRATPCTLYSCRVHRISTHALREEGDSPFCATLSLSANFYPRPPRGGRRASPSWTTAAR